MKSLDKLLELCEKATPGPWTVVGNYSNTAWVDELKMGYDAEMPLNDAEFIAAANPKTVTALVTSLQEAMKALEQHVLEMSECINGVSRGFIEHPLESARKANKEAREALAKIHERWEDYNEKS